MKKFFVALVPLLITAVAVLGWYGWNKKNNEPPVTVVYASTEELEMDIARLEAMRDGSDLRWQDSFLLGVAYLTAGRVEEARGALEGATLKKPGYFETSESLGMVYFRLGEYTKAAMTWERALMANPGATHLKDMIERARRKSAVRLRLTFLEQRLGAPLLAETDLGETDDGAKWLPEGGGERPLGWVEMLELASLYMVSGEMVEDNLIKAEAAIDEVLKEKDDLPDIYLALAQVRALRGDRSGAAVAAARALELSPDDENIKRQVDAITGGGVGPPRTVR